MPYPLGRYGDPASGPHRSGSSAFGRLRADPFGRQFSDTLLGLLRPFDAQRGAAEPTTFTDINPGQPLGQAANPQAGLIPGVPFSEQQNRERIQWLNTQYGPNDMSGFLARQGAGPGISAIGPSALGEELRGMLGGQQAFAQEWARDTTQRGLGAGNQLLAALGLQTDVERARADERIRRAQLQLQQLSHIPGLANALVGLMG